MFDACEINSNVKDIYVVMYPVFFELNYTLKIPSSLLGISHKRAQIVKCLQSASGTVLCQQLGHCGMSSAILNPES